MRDVERRDVDTDPHPVFSTYSAGNFGEVAPDRLSPMSWSLVGVPVETGMRRVISRLWPRSQWASGSHFVFVGYFACKPYHNLSALCHAARQVPGLEADAVVRAYFQGSGPPRVPSHRPSAAVRARVLPRLLREFGAVHRAARRIAEQVAVAESDVHAALERGSALDAGRLLPSVQTVLDAAWEAHYTCTMLLVPLTTAQSWVAGRLVDYWSELEPWVNRPGGLVWAELADLNQRGGPAEATAFLSRSFYEIADGHEPWCAFRTRPALDVTSRLANEHRPDLWDPVPLSRAALLPQLTDLVCTSLEQRERTKSLAMRAMHLARRLVPWVAEIRGLDDEQWPYATVQELMDTRRCVDELRALVDRRRAACERALDVAMPDLLETAADAVSRRVDPVAPASGLGVYPGRAEGVVVGLDLDVDSPCSPPPGDGRVLVCEAADVDVRRLLPHVDALVTARGSALSHIAILVREYGLPSVLGHPLASSLRKGQRVSVDGATGEVRLVEDA